MDNRATMQRSLDYIEDNLQAQITAAELAEQAGFSLFHYYRLFQQATGLPVMQYILRRRLLHGVYAMKQGSSKIDAALRFGFDTYAGFYKAFYLTKRLPGKQMGSHSFSREDGRFVGEIIGQLHLALSQVEACLTDADLLGTVRDWALPRAKEALCLPDSFCKEYLHTFADLYPKLPRQIIHRDPNPGNIIRGEDQWGFIDFDLSERNVRIYDPCYAATAVLSECFGADREQWLEICRNIICGYDSVAHLTEEERKAIPYVILANQFVCVAWFAGQDKYREIFEINKRMTVWLIEKFEELILISQ